MDGAGSVQRSCRLGTSAHMGGAGGKGLGWRTGTPRRLQGSGWASVAV